MAGGVVALLLAEGGRYPPMTVSLFVVGIAGIAYSLRAMAIGNEKCDERDTNSPLKGAEVSVHVVDEIQRFKALLAEALPRSEASTWLLSPHPVLDGATPVEVFFRHGLEATRGAVTHSQEDKRARL